MAGLTSMRLLRRGRSDAPIGSIHENLGKSLRHTQTVHATDMTDQGSVATRPIVQSRNMMLSSTGGLQRDIQEPFKHPRSKVLKLSHHDSKLHKLTDFQGARKTFTSNNAKAGL
mgnify:FL=1